MDQWEELARWAALDLRDAKFARVCEVNDRVTQDEIDEYISVLDSASTEKPLQKFLSDHLHLAPMGMELCCHWVKSHPQLGGRYEPDFMASRVDSNGMTWKLVELQSPTAQLFTKSGRPTEQLDEGIHQILDWRYWISENLDSARKPRSRQGLGLYGVTSQAVGVIYIGRSNDKSEDDARRLAQLIIDHRIDVRSYDYVARVASRRIESGEAPRNCEECTLIRDIAHPRRSRRGDSNS